MIVHGEDETDESESRSQLVRENESSSSQVEGVSRGFSGEELPDSWYISDTLLLTLSGAYPLIPNRRFYFLQYHPMYWKERYMDI